MTKIIIEMDAAADYAAGIVTNLLTAIRTAPPLPPPATTSTGCPPVVTNTLSPKGPSPTPPRGRCKVCGDDRCGPGYDVCYECHFDDRDEIAGGTRRMREG